MRRLAVSLRLKTDIEATAGFLNIHGPRQNLGPSAAGCVGASGGTGERFAFLADEDVVESARLQVEEDTKKKAEVGSDGDLDDYVDKEEADYDYWAVQEEATVNDLIWNKLCKDMTAAPPNLLIEGF